MFTLVKKSSKGTTRWVDSIYFDIEKPNTYASYILLKNYYAERDIDSISSISNRMRMVGFSRTFLTKIKNKTKQLCCHYCDKTDLIIEFDGMKVPHSQKATIDHVVPISKGGALFDKNNLVVACGTCNGKKGDKTLEEFLKDRNRLTKAQILSMSDTIDYTANIGKKCSKTVFNPKNSPKPFKSGFKTNTIKGVIQHPILLDRMAYTFNEDDSFVECWRCEILD